MKPLFIPLYGCYYDQFIAGTKNTEVRPYGPRWNHTTCAPGRRVTLSRGFSRKTRRTGTIIYTRSSPRGAHPELEPLPLPGPPEQIIITIRIELDPPTT